MAVASAGLYASLHLIPDNDANIPPTTQFFTGQMPFLPPSQQRQSTEGMILINGGSRYRVIGDQDRCEWVNVSSSTDSLG